MSKKQYKKMSEWFAEFEEQNSDKSFPWLTQMTCDKAERYYHREFDVCDVIDALEWAGIITESSDE